MRELAILPLLLLCACATTAPRAAYDLVIRNGALLDGSGREAVRGDLAIDGDRIAAVGRVEGAGRKLGDSALIIEHLVAKHGDKLDAHLTPAERAHGRALRRMTEEGLYFPILYSRWVDDAGFAVVGPVFFAAIPALLRGVLGSFVRRNTRKVLQAQGTGRHTREEIYALGSADLQALSDALGDKMFFLGDKPTSYDAAIYGTLHNLMEVPTGTPLPTFARSLPNLVAFCERVGKRCFEDSSEKTHQSSS